MDESRAFSVSEVASRSGVSERTVRRLIATKRLRAVRLGRRVIVPQDALVDLLAGRD
jgi:excisionase family DNA binding protein